MKLRFYTWLGITAELCSIPFNALTEWARHKATTENLKSCNLRAVRR